jgi:hypothetical protein
MCDPVSMTVATVAMTAVSTGMSYMQQSQAAADANEYEMANAAARQAQMNANAELANRSFGEQNAALNKRAQQETDAASLKIQQTNVEALERAETAKVAAAEAGVTGLSVDALIGDFYGDAARTIDVTKQNRDMTLDELEASKKEARSTAEGRIQSVTPYLPRLTRGPSMLGAAIQVGASAVSASDKYFGISERLSLRRTGTGYKR